MLNRRKFIQRAGIASFGLLGTNGLFRFNSDKTHIVSLSFDDGFIKSFIKTAEIYEKYKLSACFNIIATAHLDAFKPPDGYIKPGILGDFTLWNELQSRGHEIMPHGYNHTNLAQAPIEEAKDLIKRSLAYFEKHLKNFNARKSVFNFPFNSSNVDIESWLGTQVMAYRTAGNAINSWPDKNRKKLTCISYGPDNIDDYLQDQLDQFLREPGGWFIFNTHGLDGEGWGPLSSGLLDELLGKLLNYDHVDILPVGKAFIQYG